MNEDNPSDNLHNFEANMWFIDEDCDTDDILLNDADETLSVMTPYDPPRDLDVVHCGYYTLY